MTAKNCNMAEAKALNVWQMMGDEWNDKTFAPVTEAQPNWHPSLESSEK